MDEAQQVQYLRRMMAVLRMTLGIILLVTWYENLMTGLYTADGIVGLFNWIFNDTGGGPSFYRSFVQSTILQAPGLFAIFQLVAEFLLGLGLLIGGFTPLIGFAAMLFFLNLFLAFLGGSEWIWTYVLLTSAAFVVSVTKSGRALGLDQYLVTSRGEPPLFFLW